MLKVTSRDGTVIAYDKKGQGPVLILVLGALNRRSQGKKLTELLADRFTVVSYDRRGRGDSTDVSPYSTDKEVEDLEALIDATGGEAYLYGHSSGCILAADKRGDAVALFVKSVGVTDKQIAAMQRLSLWKGLTAMAPTLAYDTIELMTQFPKIDATAVQTETLVMYGAASPDFMGKTAEKLSKTLPHAKLQALEGQTHDVKATVLALVLADFFL